MKRFALLTTVLAAVLTLALPFVGGGGPGLGTSLALASSSRAGVPIFATSVIAPVELAPAVQTAAVSANEAVLLKKQTATAAYLKTDTEHLGQKPVPIPVVVVPEPAGASGSGRTVSRGGPTASRSGTAASTADRRAAAAAGGSSCPTGGGGGGSAPGGGEAGIGGTTTADIQSFAATYNAIRVANCLQPVASGNFRYDSCMEQRLYWMAEDPSTNPGNTWGHAGVRSLAPDANGVLYSSAVPAKGCDGNLAGGSGNSGATVAQKWWDSLDHRLSLYRPSVASTAGVCIYFAMTHGGIPGENPGYTRAAARWGGC